MRKHNKLSHAAKTSTQRKDYVDAVLGTTATSPAIDTKAQANDLDTVPATTRGDVEPLDDPGRPPFQPPYRSFRSKLSGGLEENLLKILGAVILAAVGVIGYLFVQVSSDNREIGELKTKAEDTSTTVENISNKQEALDQKENELDKVLAVIQDRLNFSGRK